MLFLFISVHYCRADFNSTAGWISSPDSNGDGWYDNSMNCTWTLFVEQNSVLEILVNITDIECGFDYLQVQYK